MPTYLDTLRMSWEDVSVRFINFLPNFVVAIVVLIVGWIIINAVVKLIKSILVSAKVDEVGQKMGMDQLTSRTGLRMTISGGIAWVVKWFLLIVLFLAVTDYLGLDQISVFLNRVLEYIPNVIAAAGILLIGMLVARFLSRVVRHTVTAGGFASGEFLGTVTQWAVMVFAILATLDQLKVAQTFVQTLFTGFIVMLAVAGGLAFGLGGKEHASRVLDKLERDIKS